MLQIQMKIFGSAYKKRAMISWLKGIFALSIIMLITVNANGQIKVGSNAPIPNSVIFQLGDSDGINNRKGIILPSIFTSLSGLTVDNSSNNVNNGTIVFDVNDKNIKIFQEGKWISLTTSGSNNKIIEKFSVTNLNDLETKANLNENTESIGVILGNGTSLQPETKGALIISGDGTQAMMLPHIFQPHINVENPHPGFICYDTEKGTLAMFNGTEWHYWK